ncbi:hypothetical protein RUM43_012048 [Polyplax serrata]|uniref:Uncharacterized protein n=1 Tax=Polyplax serrata TaxID=468196 RepID=A0AAN8S4B5_POLSC
MKKDFLEIEDKISDVAKQLKNERIELIKKKLKLNDTPIELDESLLSNEKTLSVGSARENGSLQRIEPVQFPVNIESKLGLVQPLDARKSADVLNYFQNLMESRKTIMWPSRRIDELQGMLMPH